MSRLTRLFLYLCAALLTCLFWGDVPARSIHRWTPLTAAGNSVREEMTRLDPEADAESISDRERRQTLAWEAEQRRRKVGLQRACRQWRPKAKEYLPRGRVDMFSFLVDDRHKALYCYLPKVSCTNWKRLWMILTGLTQEQNPLAIDGLLPHLMHNDMMLALQPHNDTELQGKLDSYTKLLVVRDPYERLLSAYRDKLEHGQNKTHWRRYIDNIINYNKKHESSANTEITFSAFVNYVSGLGKADFNEHWSPYHRLCYPCAIKYDVIAKYETLTQDSDRFLHLIGAPDNLHFPPYVPSKTPSLLPQYMANLSLAQRHSLYQVYQRDFEAFEYQPFGGLD